MLTRTRAQRFLLVLILLSYFGVSLFGQTQLASLRPGHRLVWQRTSPTAQAPDGPVLYQLLFSGSGTPGTVPAFDTNPRHLTNSPITVSGGNVVIGGASGMSISGTTGIITFANGQTFPGTTGVNSVTAGNGFITIGGTPANPTVGLNTPSTDARYLTLSGGAMTGNITFAPSQTFPSSGLPNLVGEVTGPPEITVVSNAVSANTASAIVRRDGTGGFSAGTITVSGNLALPNTASASVGVLILGGAPFLHNFGSENTFLGQSAGNLTMTASFNTATGKGALGSATSGGSNTAVGWFALANNTTGSSNTAHGAGVLNVNTTGDSNTGSGWGALANNTTASNNTATGFTALFHNTTGTGNTATGSGALSLNTSGNNNTATGFNALDLSTGNANTANGFNALSSNTNGFNNTAIGNSALLSNTTGGNNTAIGWFALSGNTNADDNTAIGRASLSNNQSGTNNTAVGSTALGSNTTGISNTAIGSSANVSAGNLNNATAIGAGAIVNASNKIRLGNTSVSSIEAQVGLTVVSDRNQKENFESVEGEQVLRKIGTLQLTSWNLRGQDPKQFRHYGPVAQEFFAAFGHDRIGTIGTPTTINSQDFDGILMIAVRALEKRTQEVSRQRRNLEIQRGQLARQQREIKILEERVRDLMRTAELKQNLASSREKQAVARAFGPVKR